MMTDNKCSNAKIEPPANRNDSVDDDTGRGDLQDKSLLSPARANYRSKSLPKSFMRNR